MNESDYEKVPLKTKLFGSFGSLGLNLTTNLFLTWTWIYYIYIVGIDPLRYSLAFLIYMIWNAINDPLFGHLSDRTRTKYGRRIPYLMICSPLLSINFIILYFAPIGSSQWIKFTWLLINLFTYDAFYTIVSITFTSLLAELSINPQERAMINLFAGIGNGIGFGIAYLLPLLLVNPVAIPYTQNKDIFQFIFIILAVLGAIFLAFTAFGIKERPELLPEKEERLGILQSIKNVLANRSFITYSIFNFMVSYLIFSINSNLPFYIKDVLKISKDNLIASIPLISFLTFSIIGFPIILLLNKKIGNKRTLFYSLFLTIIGLINITFSGDIILVSISFAVVGLGFSGTLLVFTLLGDIIDQDELKTGVRREGAYFGTDALINKPAQSVSAGISGLVLFLTNFNQNLGVGESQPDSAIFGIKMLLGVIPAIFIILGLISLWYYPLDSRTKEYKEMKRKVMVLHDGKLQRLRERLGKKTDN
ncbi:MAG: MFS transporter [Candidatus Odinarchaeota archaeon]